MKQVIARSARAGLIGLALLSLVLGNAGVADAKPKTIKDVIEEAKEIVDDDQSQVQF